MGDRCAQAGNTGLPRRLRKQGAYASAAASPKAFAGKGRCIAVGRWRLARSPTELGSRRNERTGAAIIPGRLRNVTERISVKLRIGAAPVGALWNGASRIHVIRILEIRATDREHEWAGTGIVDVQAGGALR